jgi:hypothetical protein
LTPTGNIDLYSGGLGSGDQEIAALDLYSLADWLKVNFLGSYDEPLALARLCELPEAGPAI